MVETPNHKYNAPKAGTDNWHVPLNENFENLDADVEIRDSEAKKGNYEPKQGAKFEATDSGAVYYGNGSSWVLADRTVKSLTADEVASKSRAADVVVYQDSGTYKAVGQTGRVASGSDAGGVIQSAVDDAGVGGVVQIGTGTFNCGSHITLHESQWLRGAGMYQTELKATSNIGDHLVQAQDNNGSSREERIRISEFAVDMDNRGYAAVFLFIAQECIVERIWAKNAGSRGGGNNGGILLRNAFSTDGYDHWIVNNRADNCSNVSIDCGAGGTDPARAIVYGNKIYNPNDGGNFGPHGISVENIDYSTVMGNTAIINDGSKRWQPALNINAASYTAVTGNTLQNAGGIATANGPGIGNEYTNNTIYGGGISIKTSGAGVVKDNLIHGNTIDRSINNGPAVSVGDDSHANVCNNIIRGSAGGGHLIEVGNASGPRKPCHIIGNQFYNITGKAVRTLNSSTSEYMLFSNNIFERGQSDVNAPIVDLRETNGLAIGNVMDHVPDGGGHETFDLNINAAATGNWLIACNYIRSITNRIGRIRGGIATNNIFDGGSVSFVNGTVFNQNVALNSATIDTNVGSYTPGMARSGSYIGDGTTDRLIETAIDPEYVVVQGSDGTKYDVHVQWGENYQHTSPAGELSIVDGGFKIGDSGADEDPNTDTESYSFYAR